MQGTLGSGKAWLRGEEEENGGVSGEDWGPQNPRMVREDRPQDDGGPGESPPPRGDLTGVG